MAEIAGSETWFHEGVEVGSIPTRLRVRAAALGAAGEQWIRTLPELIAEASEAWELSVGPVLDGGTQAYVAAARTADGAEAVLKIGAPDLDDRAAVRVLEGADGRGYVRVLRSAPERRLLLLERLGPSLNESGLAVEQQLRVLTSALRVAWTVPAPAVLSLPTSMDKARWLATFIADAWEQQGWPCSRAAVERALSYAEARAAAYDERSAVLLHGDAHSSNALREPGAESWSVRFVDPEPFIGERAYDLGVMIRDWSTELLGGDPIGIAREWCRTLGVATGVDAEDIWQWAFVERVSTGLYLRHFGHTEEGDQLLAVAERWIR